MPTYVYQCARCDEVIEAFQSFSDPALTTHEGCGGDLRKVFQPSGVVFKGSGFYKTDSRSKTGSKSGSKSGGTSESSSGSSSGSD